MSDRKVKFTILGPPIGKGRPRFTREGRTYTTEKTASYENLVKLEYEQQCRGYRFPDDAQLDIRITAYFGIPKSVSKKKRAEMLAHKIRPKKVPDWDNIGKIVADSLNKIAYHDDSQVVDGQVRKFFGETPKVVVVIQEAM